MALGGFVHFYIWNRRMARQKNYCRFLPSATQEQVPVARLPSTHCHTACRNAGMPSAMLGGDRQIISFKQLLRQDPPWFEFLVIFDFFAPWYRRGWEASSVKILWKNSKEKLVKYATEVGRLHRVSIQSCTQKRPSPKVQSLSRDLI